MIERVGTMLFIGQTSLDNLGTILVVAVLVAFGSLALTIYTLCTVARQLAAKNTALASEILVYKAFEKGGPAMAAGVLSAQKLVGIAQQPKSAPQEKKKELPKKQPGLEITQKFQS
jgi:hypothetical protein